MLNNDNTETRQTVEFCFRKSKTLLNPIIDWEDEDVWEFIHKYSIPYCELYDQGHKRLGCIGCPMCGGFLMKREFERYPKYRANYIRAFNKMVEIRNERHLKTMWQDGEDVMAWWVGDLKFNDQDELTLFDE